MSPSIWFSPPDLDALNALHAGGINGHLGVEVTDCGPDWLAGRMPVDARTTQPYGLLHGGASVVLAETLGSAAANFTVNPDLQFVVGQEVNASHIRGVRSGYVHAVAKALHVGRSAQVWGIELRDDDDRLTCVVRLTVSVLSRR